MDNHKVKCSKVRKCKWKGVYSELVEVPKHDEHFIMTEKVCPKCGHNEFYDVSCNQKD